MSQYIVIDYSERNPKYTSGGHGYTTYLWPQDEVKVETPYGDVWYFTQRKPPEKITSMTKRIRQAYQIIRYGYSKEKSQ